MKLLLLCGCLILTFAPGVRAEPSYDPALFEVAGIRTEYALCPAGDIPITAAINYDGSPLDLTCFDLFMKVEVTSGLLPLCPSEAPDHPAYHMFPDPGGNIYYWSFQACNSNNGFVKISIHLIDDPEPFFTIEGVHIRSFDVNGDGLAGELDMFIIESYYPYPPVGPWASYDLNFDGVIDEWDLLWGGGLLCGTTCGPSHFGHNCYNRIGTSQSSWGKLKSLFRRQ